MSVGDTGIDYTGSPLFADSRDARAAPLVLRGDVPSAAALGARLAALEAANDSGEEEEGVFVLHRKLKALWPLMDDRDYAGGHGSHVSGTVAGAIEETIDPTAAAAAAGGGGGAGGDRPSVDARSAALDDRRRAARSTIGDRDDEGYEETVDRRDRSASLGQ